MGYYETLGLEKGASLDTIKKAYKKLAMKWHPDRHASKESGEREVAEEKFKGISEAYQVLSDPAKKSNYDQFGREDMQGLDMSDIPIFGGMPGVFTSMGGPNDGGIPFMNPNVLFSHMFPEIILGGGLNTRSRRSSCAYAPPDPIHIERDLECTLDELFCGCTKKLRVTNPTFHGSSKVLEVQVQRGWKAGTSITFQEQQDLGMTVKFKIVEKPHPFLRREKNHLHWDCTLTPEQMHKGVHIEIPMPDQKNVRISTENRHIFPGKIMLVKNKGMPHKDGRGDLYVHFHDG